MLQLTPGLPAGLRRVAEARVRFGRTLVDLALVRLPGRVTLRLACRFGPALPTRVRWGGIEPLATLLVDGVELAPGEVSFEVRGEHEIQFLLRDA